MSDKKPDRTRNIRQARRRQREKRWLTEHSWTSWEALHSVLVKGEYLVVNNTEIQINTVGSKEKKDRDISIL